MEHDVAHLFVSKQLAMTNDSIHFTRISDALLFARAGRLYARRDITAACRIDYIGRFRTLPGQHGWHRCPRYRQVATDH